MQVVLIGGSHGIGYQYYRRLKNKGDRVKVYSRNQRHIESSDFYTFDASQFDADRDELPEVYDTVDALVYFPGRLELGHFDKFDRQDLLQDLDQNIVSAFQVVKSLKPNLENSERASVTLMSHVAGQVGMPLYSQVGVCKGAVNGFVKNLAAELAPRIRVNAVSSSYVSSEASKEVSQKPSVYNKIVDRHPLKRVGDPGEVADTVMIVTHFAWWMTGQVLPIDGGISGIR